MARFVAGNTTGAGSSTLPIISLYGAASNGGYIKEIGVFNTTTTAVALKLCRLSTAGTSSAIATIGEYDADIAAATCSPRQTHSSTGPTFTDLGYFFRLAGSVGSGVILTFGDTGLRVPTGTANGVGVIPTGTGQICDAYVVWEE